MATETRETARDRFDRTALLDAIQELVVSERDLDSSFEHIQRDPILLDVCRKGHRLIVAAGPGPRLVEGQIRFSEQCDDRAPTIRFLVTRDPDDATAFQYDDEEARSLDGVAVRIVQEFLDKTADRN
ncbi:MAG TPA: hypothetical protein VH583_25655 [Vicinamibacterales bacterium]|jgi:hypothetical protein